LGSPGDVPAEERLLATVVDLVNRKDAAHFGRHVELSAGPRIRVENPLGGRRADDAQVVVLQSKMFTN
jgi:hypothetical protein